MNQAKHTIDNLKKPVLYIVIPCYNEQEVLPITSSMFGNKIKDLVKSNLIHEDSKVLFVDDGSTDGTWDYIVSLSNNDSCFQGASLSHNRGHQNALFAGLMEVKNKCDICVSMDCDGQDDINVVEDMVKEYMAGSEIVYGVRSKREKDTFFKRFTAQLYYKLLSKMGVEVIYNHADYRLLSNKVLNVLSDYKEVNLFLRGLFPSIGFKHSVVYYERDERKGGTTHYPLKKMLGLAFDGITSFSIKPLRLIMTIGFIIAFFSFIGIVYVIVGKIKGTTIEGWASMASFLCLISGVQLISLGIIGEYIGKIYLETKGRPRYIIKKRTY